MKKLKRWLVVELVKMNELLNGSLKFKELTIEKLRETRDTLESQNKALQDENESLQSANTWIKNENAKIEKEMRFSDAIADKQARLIEKMHGELDEVRKAKEDCLTNIQSLNVEIGSMWTKNQELQSDLNSFEDLKKEADSVSSGVEVWVAMDAPISSDESYIYMYNQEPILNMRKGVHENENGQYADLSGLDLTINLQPLQCKKYILNEVKE